MTGVCGITYAALMRPPALLTRRRILAVAAGGAASLPVAGCGPIARGPAVPVAQTAQASVLGLPNEHFFVFTETESLEREMVDALDRKRRRLGLKGA